MEDRTPVRDHQEIRHGRGRWKAQREYLRAHGFVRGARIHPLLQWYNQGPDRDRPNIIVMGVDHSGTSILTRMLFGLGWKQLDADREYAESVAVRALNIEANRGRRRVDQRRALKLLERQGSWVIKDPRFSMRLGDWLYPCSQLTRPPFLIWIRRDLDAVAESFRRRREHRGRERIAADNLYRSAAEKYHIWPWAKLAIDYEQVAEATRMFEPR